ncbi:MAG: 3-dehydroquinate synthase [Bacteroidales bacterium]|nr:3-dehydroquinate synthase [Candidatus Egerieousia equi]
MKIKITAHKDFTILKSLLQEYSSVFVVYDRNVEKYAQELNFPALAIEATEANKTFGTVIDICNFLLAHHADRNSLLLAIGGGITTDLAGFAACIFKRGIRYANVPTTLLAQVDAGIGGKTGCNLDSFKNMLGIIRQPEFTYLSSYTLDSLPLREFRSGIAEMLKTFIIASAEDYVKAVELFSKDAATIGCLLSRVKAEGTNEESAFRECLEELIEKAARIKAGIVEQDADEKGLRRVLNLGHTYGHAIEWWQQQNISLANERAGVQEIHSDEKESTDAQSCLLKASFTHGEAVATGIVKIARISEERGIATKGLAERFRADFQACGLPVDLPCPESLLAEAISQDKKLENGKVHFVLIQDIGKVVVE